MCSQFILYVDVVSFVHSITPALYTYLFQLWFFISYNAIVSISVVFLLSFICEQPSLFQYRIVVTIRFFFPRLSMFTAQYKCRWSLLYRYHRNRVEPDELSGSSPKWKYQEWRAIIRTQTQLIPNNNE